MKNQENDQNIILCHEKQEVEFRKNKFEIVYHFYQELDTKEEFTTTEIDELNSRQVHNLYRQKFAIPFPDEIKSIREQYGLPAIGMSKLLGFGSNQYRKYEEGEMPSVSNGKMIEALKDPLFFGDIFNRSKGNFTSKEVLKIDKRIKELIDEKASPNSILNKYIFKNHTSFRVATNGFASILPEKVRQIIIFFTSSLGGVFETKLNKLLFYSDFLFYKLYWRGMSGLQYQAITFGPVPVHYSTIYENLEGLKKDIVDMGNGYAGNKIFTEEAVDASLFTEKELQVLTQVLTRFREVKAGEISEMSHKEEAWIQNQSTKALIDYNYAFYLNPF